MDDSHIDEQSDAAEGLAPASVSLLEDWLASQKDQWPAAKPSPNVAQMVSYLCRMLSTEDMVETDQALIDNPEACILLEEVLSCLDEIQQRPWQEVAARANGGDLMAQVARAWFALASRNVEAASRARREWAEQGWEGIVRLAAEGNAEAQVAWAAFVAFGRWLMTRLLQPQPALARAVNASPATVAGELPFGTELAVTTAEVTGEGTLHIVVAARQADGRPTGALDGRHLTVSLACEGQTWTIASGRIVQDGIQWEMPDLGRILQLPKGDLPARFLHLAMDEAESARLEVVTLPAAVIGEDRAMAVELELHGLPHWQAGELAMLLAIPAAIRGMYVRYRLSLDILVATDQWQRLGEWPVSDWEDTPRLLLASCPGITVTSEVTVPFLRVTLSLQEGSFLT